MAAQNIQNSVALYQEEVANKELQLEKQAQEIVDDSHSVPFWKQALGTLSAVASVCPVGQPVLGSIGKGLSILDNIDETTPLDTIKQAGSLAGDFSQANVKKSVQDYHDQIAKLDPSKASNAQAYVKGLVPFANKLASSYEAVNKSVQSHQASQSEVDAQLSQLKASDPTFTKLVDDLDRLNQQKQLFSQQLAQATDLTSSLASDITADWRALDSVNDAISTEIGVDDHQAVQEVQEFARRVRDRLLKYQYYMAKAYEYRMLRPYQGDFNLNDLSQKITDIISGPHDASYKPLSPTEFDTLKSVYVESVREVVSDSTNKVQSNPKQHGLPYPYSLTPSEINQLNASGSVDIDLSRVVPHFDRQENRRLDDISVDSIKTKGAGTDTMFVTFDHWGTSVFRSEKHSYVFDHRRTMEDLPFEWGGTYNRNARPQWSPETTSPTYVALVRSLIYPGKYQADPGAAQGVLEDLFVDPGLDATITVRRQGGDKTEISSLNLRLTYSFDRNAASEYYLDVDAPKGMTPLIQVGPKDESDRSMGIGSFTRVFLPGAHVTLIAPPAFGNQHFVGWQVGNSTVKTTKLVLTMNGSQRVSLIYR